MIALAVCIALVAAAALAGSRFRPDAWYAALRKPAFNPPKGVFAPVWTTLYVAIAVAGWRVWTDNGGAISTALVLWCVQLALNAAWSWHLLSSLLVFNIGLEAVQLSIIAIVFPVLALLRRRTPSLGLVTTGAIAASVTVMGLLWFGERITGA